MLLTDAPGAFPWLGVPTEGDDAPGPEARVLWRRLAAGRRAHILTPAAEDAFWALGCAVDEADGSQYDTLRALAATGELPAGNVFCLANCGSGFHGREDRPWVALAGNLHLSAALTADLPASVWGPVLPALPALAVCAAARALLGSGAAVGIKWINDVVVGGAKVAGGLTALRTRDGRIERVFLGIGVNVAAAPAPSDAACLLPATSLSVAAGRSLGPAEAGPAVLAALAARWNALLDAGPRALAADYRAASLVVGRRVAVQVDGDPEGAARTGRVRSIGDDLALQLDSGPPIRSGRIVRLED